MAVALIAFGLMACGGGGGGSGGGGSSGGGGGSGGGATTYAIGGAVSGLASGATLVLQNNGANNLSVTANGGFSFSTHLAQGAAYAVTVLTQPSGQTCTVSSGSGTVGAADVTNVQVSCASSGGGTVIFFDDFNGASLGGDWSIISRHGAYFQSETECNTAGQVAVSGGMLTITTKAQATTCGDFNLDGSVRNAPQSWPYATGAVQWKSLSFTYGTVEVRAKFPPEASHTWPAIWLIGANCQATNVFTADVDYDTCPSMNSSHYAEIDAVECDTANWCQLALANFANAGSGGHQFPTCGYPVDGNFHTFKLTWTATAVRVYVDGVDTGCSFASPAWTIPSTPMFLIIQTQTGGIGGTPSNANLPADFQIDWVRVTQP